MVRSKEYTEEDYLHEISRLWSLLDAQKIPFEKPEGIQKKVEELHLLKAEDPLDYARGLRLQSSRLGLFHQYFCGRPDAFYRRSKNGAWYAPCLKAEDPSCPRKKPDYVWKPGISPCRSCSLKQNALLQPQDLLAHLCSRTGRETLRISPLLEDGTTWFLVFDLEGLHGKKEEHWESACSLLRSVHRAGFDGLLERSASQSGFHLWLFFSSPVEVSKAVSFGQMLVLQAVRQEGLQDFSCFDTLIPEGPPRKKGAAGRSVELPLQYRQVQEGKTLFLQENGTPFLDPWKALADTSRIEEARMDLFLKRTRTEGWNRLLTPVFEDPLKDSFSYAGSLLEPDIQSTSPLSTISGPLSVRLSSQISLSLDRIPGPALAELLLMGSCWNPEYTGRKARFASGPHVLSLSRVEKNRLFLPRGLLEPLEARLHQAGISFTLEDHTSAGTPLEICCLAELRSEQQELLAALSSRRCGILEAATGAGKTVMGAALIAQRKTSTLILVSSQEILQGWVRTLNEFLRFEQSCYEDIQLASRKYPGKIGVLQAGTDTLTGRVDVAMIPSLFGRKDLKDLLGQYGMILFDECHHAASASSQKILQQASSRFVYGLSATPERNDGLSAIVHLQLGQVLSRFTSKEQMASQNFERRILPRPTSFGLKRQEQEMDFMRTAQEAAWDPLRNAMILEDVRTALSLKRKVLVLTRLVDHARFLARWIRRENPQVSVLIYAGDPKEKQDNARRLNALHSEPVILVGTYASIGEGFDYPPLDTLMLALPVRSSISVSQAVGRIHRQTESKRDVLVYDYVDQEIPVLETMYQARMQEYSRQGYRLASSPLKADSRKTSLLEKTQRFDASLECVDMMNARLRLEKDFPGARQKIAAAARELSLEELDRFVEWTDSLRRQSGFSVRVDLFVERMDELQKERLARLQIHLHLHERIIGCFVILDQKTVWYGPVFSSDSSDQLIRMDCAGFADDLLSLRRKEEIRLLQNARS